MSVKDINSADTTPLKRDPPKRRRTGIDQLVYKLYGLTPAIKTAGKPEEIAIVEGKSEP